ncbi:MAG TPA: ferric reductase-like transmembrane domain-containing protein, partial [Rubrobacteraceae bacterium]|nr:ferric reductase-like transmembrane domain-containing protein [Rubrobacteraceae bacterium]
MSASLVTLLSLTLAGSALGAAIVAVVQMVVRKEATASPAWLASVLGVLGLTAAVAGGSIHPLDLATVAGVVLLGGIAGAGWAPSGRRSLLGLGLLFLAFGFFIRLESFSEILSSVAGTGWEAVAGAGSGGIAWGAARSAGFVAFVCATGAVLLGTRRPARLPVGGRPARVYALHRALGITSILALAVHLTGLWLDSYVQFGWAQLLASPWTSTYRPLAVTLGWLAMLALLLTAASGGLRRLLPGWRIVHALAYLTFALGLT